MNYNECNGWTNSETWGTNLIFSNIEHIYHQAVEYAQKANDIMELISDFTDLMYSSPEVAEQIDGNFDEVDIPRIASVWWEEENGGTIEMYQAVYYKGKIVALGCLYANSIPDKKELEDAIANNVDVIFDDEENETFRDISEKEEYKHILSLISNGLYIGMKHRARRYSDEETVNVEYFDPETRCFITGVYGIEF